MKLVSNCFEKWTLEYISYQEVITNSTMHRLTLDRYIKTATDQGLFKWVGEEYLKFTEKGLDYLVSHKIIA